MPIVKKATDDWNRGFTLIEMSIVLVIIGLIIGGILKGQEIIASARQKAVINQVNAVRSAANTYFDRYRALPGDDPNATKIDPALSAGDGNGVVGGNYANAAALGGAITTSPVSENYQFFNGLMASNLLNGGHVTSGTTPTGGTLQFGTTALPAAPITGSGMTVIYGTQGGGGVGLARTTHWVRIHKGPDYSQAPIVALSPRTLANIDIQTDDGLPDNGGVRANDATSCNTVGGDYLASDDPGCIPLFEITQ